MKPSFLKVEGHTSLVRDVSSNAIISTNDADYNAYRKRAQLERNRLVTATKQSEDIDLLKKDISDIKEMLTQLLRGKQ